ncbi:MAG: flagellar motor protein [Proteobacteria bacterium]|jgi:chemotaxis protein MotA|nr:flagellar motor protein [Pseudomonadota bacterium]MBK8960127.1 flagellar motor protein [Pseudomonadota bacterium]
MKKFDLLSLSGVAVAIIAVLLGQHLEGGSITTLLNGPAILIVVGGSIGATMLQSPMPVFVRAMSMLVWVVRPPLVQPETQLKEIVRWAQLARREGLLGLEDVVESVRDAYARKGLQLVIDGNDPETIRETLELDAMARERHDLNAARVIDGMGGYAPTLGILGAVMGLIEVMNNLADPAMLGQGIAVAFVATVYGVGLANLVFLPTANKLKALVREQSRHKELLTVGIMAIAAGDNPRSVEARLQGLIV